MSLPLPSDFSDPLRSCDFCDYCNFCGGSDRVDFYDLVIGLIGFSRLPCPEFSYCSVMCVCLASICDSPRLCDVLVGWVICWVLLF